MRFPHFAWYPFEGIDEHIYTIQQFFRTQQWSVMKSRFQKQLPELLKVLSTGNVWISVQKLSFKFPHVEKQWDDVIIVHKLRKQKLHDYLLPYKEKLLWCDATIAQTLSDQDVLYLLMCTCDIATHAEYQFSWKWLEKDAVTLRIKENLVKTLNKQPSALELQYQAKNEKTTWGRSKSWNITKELHTLFWSWSVEWATIQKSKKAVEEQPWMKKLPLIWWDKYFAQWNQWYKQITWYFEEYTALNKNYMKKDMHFLLNSLTAYLSACFTDITFLIDNQENTKTTLTKNRSYYWLKTEIEYMERMRRVGNYQMIEAKIMKQSAEMWIQQFEWALSWNKDDETEWYVNEIGDSLEEKKDALWVQWISVYEPYILSLYKSYHALGRASGKSLKREEIMQYVQKNILHDYCTTHLKMYMLLHKNHQEMVRFWKSKMLVEQLFDQQNNQLSWDQKITVDHVGFIVESLWQWLFGTSFDRERYITILSQQQSKEPLDQGNDEMINYQERNDHGDEQNRANTYEWNTVSPEDEIESVELTVIEKVDKLLKELPNQYTDIACANYIQTIWSLFDELLAIIDHNNLSKSELVTVTLIQHVCDYTVDLQKKYKILSDWRYSFVTMVTPLVKKKV